MKWRETNRGQLATRASELSSTGNHLEALRLLEQALGLDPKDPLILVYHGRVLHALERDHQAERSFREAIALKSNLCYAWSELGMLLKDCERFAEAAECFRKSAELRPDFSTYTVLASVELAFDADASLRDATRALELNPDWDEAIKIQNSAKQAIANRDV